MPPPNPNKPAKYPPINIIIISGPNLTLYRYSVLSESTI